LQLIAEGRYEKKTTKVEETVKIIAKENPQEVLLISNTVAATEFVKQYRALVDHLDKFEGKKLMDFLAC